MWSNNSVIIGKNCKT